MLIVLMSYFSHRTGVETDVSVRRRADVAIGPSIHRVVCVRCFPQASLYWVELLLRLLRGTAED